MVGQLAKKAGCRAVGIAGGAEKCSYVVDELGFDACIDYKRFQSPGHSTRPCVRRRRAASTVASRTWVVRCWTR